MVYWILCKKWYVKYSKTVLWHNTNKYNSIVLPFNCHLGYKYGHFAFFIQFCVK